MQEFNLFSLTKVDAQRGTEPTDPGICCCNLAEG